MKRAVAVLVALLLLSSASAYALWGVSATGEWPGTWPKELEPLRKQAKSYTHLDSERKFHEIQFKDREEFEAAWPQLLKVKDAKSPIFLTRSPAKYFGPVESGVRVWMAMKASKPVESPLEGVKNARERWMYSTHIELIVDGKIVDLNRIKLPADTPIADERFTDQQEKASTK
jgi:hypothetical protein